MSKSQRSQQVAAAVEGILQDGDEFVVHRSDQHVTVTTRDRAELPGLADTHPELYGQLLEIGAHLLKGQGGLGPVLYVIALLFCAATQMGWYRDLFGVPVENLQSFWLYMLILSVPFLINARISTIRVWLNYRRRRREILEAIRSADLTRRYVLAKIQATPDLRALARQLKLDTEDDERIGFG